MILGFVPLFVVATALVLAVVSAAMGAAVVIGQRWLTRQAPAAQSRVLLAAAVAPVFVGLTVLGGMEADVILFQCDVHGCLRDHATAWPSLSVMILVAAIAVRVGIALARAGVGARRARSMRRALESVSLKKDAGLRVLPIDEPEAFVMGVLRPQVYVSRGLLTTAGGGDLKPVLAHEQAHARRRDPLRRLIASVGLAFHLPGIAALLDRRLARAQEMAADAAAARAVGDAPRVAEVLVRLARLRKARRVPAMALLGGDLEARVRDLLRTDARPNHPRPALLLGAALALVLFALLAAHPIHTDGELLLRFLSH